MTKGQSCAVCGGVLENSTTTFTVDYGHGLFVARHVPAQVCNQCGESWIDDQTSAHLEELLEQAKTRHAAFEVIDKEQIDKIVACVHYEAGEKARVYVYGSRLDDRARGGDLDLLVETDSDLRPMQKAGIKLRLEAELGMPVDILAVKRQAIRTPFQRIALARAVTLEQRV